MTRVRRAWTTAEGRRRTRLGSRAGTAVTSVCIADSDCWKGYSQSAAGLLGTQISMEEVKEKKAGMLDEPQPEPQPQEVKKVQ